ncbi:MAG TPA: cyclic nucleotide-binding domain-containing protein [Planctomycetota bacterium]|nr:cyclic nucleotide-binding domain-containing protein [Planctomycetota bacterium]
MTTQKIGIFRHAADVRSFKAGDTVFKEGDAADVMYVVQSGDLDVVYRGAIVERMSTGDLFGEMSLISDEPRSATVIARTEARLVPIDLKGFMFLVEETPYFAVQVMKIMSSRIRHLLPKLDLQKAAQ